jgi:hypothetical protein
MWWEEFSIPPGVAELEGVLEGLHSDARAAISTTARAILKREHLTPDQYGVLIIAECPDLGLTEV